VTAETDGGPTAAAAVSPGGFACAAAPGGIVLHTAARSRLPVQAEYRPRRARLRRMAGDPPSQHQRGVRAFQTAGFLKAAGAKTPTTSTCGVLTGS